MTRIQNLDMLLNSSNINSCIIELDEFISELCKDGEDIDILNGAQRVFYLNQCFEREVNSGGFDHYFSNTGSQYAHETVSSLKIIGANKTADILQRAITLVLQLVEKNEEVDLEVWDGLDNEFYNYEEDLNYLNFEYIKNNKDLF